jgi:hypothetical protein
VETRKTPFDTRVEILTDFWETYREDEDDIEFIKFHNLALPLAFMLANDFIDMKAATESRFARLIDETFESLLKYFDNPEDTGFQDLGELTGAEDMGTEFTKKIAAAALKLKNSEGQK